jgi:aspartate/methionine/tyrosine aminotransferase
LQTDEELAIALLETKDVYVHPGHFFDFASDGYLVVSLIAREEEFASGIGRVLSAF